MKALLRKKSHSREPAPALAPPPPLPASTSTSSLEAPPPLYARFARSGSASPTVDDVGQGSGARPSIGGPMPLASKAARAQAGGRDKALPTPAPVQEAPRIGKSSSSSGFRNGNGNGYNGGREMNGGGSGIRDMNGQGQGGLPSPPTSPALAPTNVVRPMSSVLDDPFAAPRFATPPAMPRDPEMDGLNGRSKRDSMGSAYAQQAPIQPTTPRRASKLVKRAPSSSQVPQQSRAPHSPPPSFMRGPNGVITPPQSVDGHGTRSIDSHMGPRSIDGHGAGPRSLDGHLHRLPHPPPSQFQQQQQHNHNHLHKRLSKQPSQRSVHSGGPVNLYADPSHEEFDPASFASPAPSISGLPAQGQEAYAPPQPVQRKASSGVAGVGVGGGAPSVKPGQIFPARRGPLIFGAQDSGAAPRAIPASGPPQPPSAPSSSAAPQLAPGFQQQQQQRLRGPQGYGPPPQAQSVQVQRSASQQIPTPPERERETFAPPPRSSSVSQPNGGGGGGTVSYIRGPDGVLRRVQQPAPTSTQTPAHSERVLSPPPGSERMLSPPPGSSRGISPSPATSSRVLSPEAPLRALSPSPAPTARALSPPIEPGSGAGAGRQRITAEGRQRADSNARASRARKDSAAGVERQRKESAVGRQPTDSSLESASGKGRRRGKSKSGDDLDAENEREGAERERERKLTDSGTYDAYSPYDAALTFASASRPGTGTSSNRPGTGTSSAHSRPGTATSASTSRAVTPPATSLLSTSPPPMYADGLVASPIDAFAPSHSPLSHSPAPPSPLPPSRSPQPPPSPQQRRASPVQHRDRRAVSPDTMRYGSPEKPRVLPTYPTSSTPGSPRQTHRKSRAFEEQRKSRAFDESFESEGDFEPVGGMDEERRASRALLSEGFRASRALLSEEKVRLEGDREGEKRPVSYVDEKEAMREKEKEKEIGREKTVTREDRRKSRIGGIAEKRVSRLVERPVTPPATQENGNGAVQSSPTSPSRVRTRAAAGALEPVRQSVVEDSLEETYYPILKHLGEPDLLDGLMRYLTFADWLSLWTCSRQNMKYLNETPYLRELILERWLAPVGYTRWPLPSSGPGATIAQSKNKDPLPLTLKELAAYMRGVSAPPQANVLLAQDALRGQAPADAVRAAKKSTRAYNRVVLRLRAQAELVPPDRERTGRRERSEQGHGPPPSWSAGGRAAGGRSQSRAPSPTNSAWGGHSTSGHGRRPSQGGSTPPQLPVVNTTNALYRPRRAPLLRVFVPANGDWLDDQGVLEAEGELRKAGIAPFLRSGDVVWDTALGDEGNTGRMLWDGRYLIDLDYTYTPLGDVPGSLPSLAFAPSFWHRVVRTSGERGPVVHVDVSPWAEEIAGNLQLLQDRVRTETPQGNYHTVVRWVHRSSFSVRHLNPPHAPTLILPGRVSAPIDQGWYGTVVIEAEGTNEGLADLQQRCRGGFPPNAAPGHTLRRGEREFKVWRILRERSRPGEIWIRAVSYKERLLP